MWAELFKSVQPTSLKSVVDRVDRVEPNVAEVSIDPSIPPVPPPSVEYVEPGSPLTIDPRDMGPHSRNAPAIDGDDPHVFLLQADSTRISTPSTQSTPAKHGYVLTSAEKNALLLFRFDLIAEEMEAPVDGRYTADELRRGNNLAWRLMTTKKMEFEDAVNVAAGWVIAQPEHPDERNFVDVLGLFQASCIGTMKFV